MYLKIRLDLNDVISAVVIFMFSVSPPKFLCIYCRCVSVIGVWHMGITTFFSISDVNVVM